MAETARHSLLDNKVQLYMRPNSPHWQASCSVDGRQKRTTTKEESLARAKDVARDWYLGLLGKYCAGELKEGKTFKEAAMRFLDEYEVITLGQRNARHVENNRRRRYQRPAAEVCEGAGKEADLPRCYGGAKFLESTTVTALAGIVDAARMILGERAWRNW